MRKRRNEENLPSSSSSSTDSSNTNNNNGYYEVSFTSKHDLSTDLRLGLSISSHELSSSSSRGQYSDWPPIKQLLRSTLAAGKSNNNNNNNNNNINSDNNSYYNNNNSRRETLYVKVYMEGIPIGRKLILLAHHGYHGLITTLVHMFRTTILYPDIAPHGSPLNCHILTYEDKDGDWMMVGDVPWE